MNVLNAYFGEIHVLSLFGQTAREEHVRNMLREMDVAFVHHVNHPIKVVTTHQFEQLGNMYFKDGTVPHNDRRRYALAALGCREAHENVLKVFASSPVKNENDTILILEDDVEFLPGWELNLVRCMSELAAITVVQGWDQFYFSGYTHSSSKIPDCENILGSFGTWNLTATAYTHAGACRAVQLLSENLGEIDEVFARHGHPYGFLEAVVAKEPLTRQRECFSAIQNKIVSGQL